MAESKHDIKIRISAEDKDFAQTIKNALKQLSELEKAQTQSQNREGFFGQKTMRDFVNETVPVFRQAIGSARKFAVNLAGIDKMLAFIVKECRDVKLPDISKNRGLNRFSQQGKTAGSLFSGFLGSIAKAGLALQAIYFAVSQIKDVAASIVMPGFELKKELETAQLGIAGILSSMTLLNGEALSFGDAMGISSDIMKQLQKDAIRTSASLGDLVTTFRAILAPGLGAGMSIEQIEQYTVVGVNAVKAMGLDSSQYVQELRDLVQGGIQPASSTLAAALGLTDADIQAAKESSEGLFKFLMKRLEGMAPMAEAFPDTLDGKLSMLKESATYASKEISDVFESEILDALTLISECIANIDTKTGEMKINPMMLDLIQDLRDGWYELCAFLDDALPRQSEQFDDVVWILRDLLNILKKVTLGAMDFLRVLSNSDIMKFFIRGVRLLTNELSYLSNAFAQFYDKRARAMGYKDDSAKKDKAAADQRNKERKEKREAGSSIDTSSLSPKFQTASQREAEEKARKQMVKDSQKALKEELETIRHFYDRQLDVYKASLEKLNVKLQDNQLSFIDAAIGELEIKTAMEQAHIDQINAQIEKVSAALYENEADRESDLNKLTNELAKHTEAQRAQNENLKGLNQMLGSLADTKLSDSNAFSAHPKGAGQTDTAKVIDSSVSGSWGKTIVQMAGRYGIDPLLAAAVMQAESHGDAEAMSAVGAVGLMQLMPSTAAGLGVNAYDPQQNIEGGVKYLRELLDSFGDDLEKVIAAYNAGPQAVKDYGGIPPYAETQGYVRQVLATYAELKNKQTDTGKVSLMPEGTTWRRETADVNIEGLDERALQAISLLSQKVKELTGNQMVVSSGLRDWGGHVSGTKFDVVDPFDSTVLEDNKDGIRDAIISYAESIGLKVLDEYRNPTANATGLHLDFDAASFAQNAIWQVDTQEQLKFKQNMKKLQSDKLDADEAFGDIFGGDLGAKLKKIDLSYQDKLEQMQRQLDTAVERGLSQLAADLEDTIGKTNAKKEYEKLNVLKDAYINKNSLNLNQIQVNAEQRASEITAGRKAIDEMTGKYYSYLYDTSQYALGEAVQKLREIRQRFEEMGALAKVQEIDTALRDFRETIDSVVDSFIAAVNEDAQWQTNMVEANGDYTNGQKEELKRQIEVQRLHKENLAYQEKLNALREESNRLLAEGRQEEAQSVQAEMEKLQRTIAYNEELAKTPELMQQVHQSAKQALEDGLNTFLTDGILYADTLKDALLDLLETVLKAIQQEFAKSLTQDIMNQWYPTQQEPVDGAETLGMDTNALAADTSAIDANFGTIVSEFNGFNVMFTQETGSFIVRLQSAFQQILQTVRSAADSIPDTSGAGSSGDFSFGSGNILDGIQYRATGGFITGPGTDTSDSIPAMLSNGEFVVRAKAVRNLVARYGRNFMDNLNSGRIDQYLHSFRVDIPKFASGGYVGSVGTAGVRQGLESFAAMIGTEVNPNIRVNNYVDGRRIFDEYGAPLVRSITKQEITRNAKLYNGIFERRR